MVNAISHEDNRAMVMTTKSGPIISPMDDWARKNARKAAEVVNEETRSGIINSRLESMAASRALLPFSILTRMDSAITMALSTSIPRAMMSAASDT